MIEAAFLLFLLGLFLGFVLGLGLGGRWLLSRMHHDDVDTAHGNYRKRREKYL